MKKGNILFNLDSIKTEQFAVFPENYSEDGEVKFNTSIEFKIEVEKKIIGAYLDFSFEQNNKPFLKITSGCNFEIEYTSWNQITKDNVIKIDKETLRNLASLSIGTVRGILHEKTNNSKYLSFNKFIIPPINLGEMIPNDATIEL
ncbi:MAG: hypothetical protein Q8K92_06630 [Leadbetterella sp.]|nr:hypothetical protein [Leadbetterella sp.]